MMKREKQILKSFLFLVVLQLSFLSSHAQEKSEGLFLYNPEVMPVFRGSAQEVHCFIHATIDKKKVSRRKVSGYSVASFIVDTTGKVTDVEIMKSLDAAIDQELVRALRQMPNWIPGRQGEKVVPVRMTVLLRVPLANYLCTEGSKE